MSEIPEQSKRVIRERIRTVAKWVTGSETDFFSSAVPENTIRNIISIRMHGQGSVRYGTISEKDEASAYTARYDKVIIQANLNVNIPNNYNIQDPILTIPGGSNVAGKVDDVQGNSLSMTMNYWDDTV